MQGGVPDAGGGLDLGLQGLFTVADLNPHQRGAPRTNRHLFQHQFHGGASDLAVGRDPVADAHQRIAKALQELLRSGSARWELLGDFER